jgi:FtsH-binding integral membrane protein
MQNPYERYEGLDRAMTTPYRLLQLALALFGLIALLLYPLAVVWPSGWAWHAGAPYESQYFMMIVGIYLTIGVFLLNAARKPEANLSFIWFVVWSSAVHAVIMAVQSFSGGHHIHMGHLWGDVPALILVAVVLAVLVRAADLRQPAAAV